MTRFDSDILEELRETQEVRIRTEKHPRNAVVIWIAVDDGEVFVRSWLGPRGRWYKDLAAGGDATVEYTGRKIPVRAIPAGDETSITRTSREFLRKYRRSSHAAEMVSAATLPTTMRLEPR